MPHAITLSITPPAKVVVTGGNGFIASHTIHRLLLAGYEVAATVRTAEKAEQVTRIFTQLLPNDVNRLQTFVILDITTPEAYTKLFQRELPEAILHLASPFSYNVNDYERDLMQPAVRGTEAVLKAAASVPSIKRIVHTNSFACIYDASLGLRPGYTYTAKDWCPLTYDDGVAASNAPIAYRASKAVAENTAWSFMKDADPQFDLVSLCPAMVFGPFLDTPDSMPSNISVLNTSNKLIWDVVSAGCENDVPPTKGPVWVDVRDVADAHVRALTLSQVGGQRLLLAKGVYCSQEIADISRELMSKMEHRIPVGELGRREADTHFAVDAGKEESLLGNDGKWRPLQETLADMLPQLYRTESHGF